MSEARETVMGDTVESISGYLSDIEYLARSGHKLSSEETLALISLLRKYMANSEETNRRVDGMIASLMP